MTLKEIRTKFVDLSGRTDLVKDTDDYVDDGADFFIKAGLRYLDNKIDTFKSRARYQEDITSGSYKLVMKYVRAIKEVYASNSDGRSRLEAKTLTWLRENYDEDFSDVDSGSPLYFSPAILGLSPEQDDLTESDYDSEFTYDSEGIMFGDHYTYNGIIIMPPVDETYTITVLGDFSSNPLESDTDKNFWSENYPDVLIYAAMYSMEKFYRNTAGAQDMLMALQDALQGIDHNLAAQESYNVDSMERSIE